MPIDASIPLQLKPIQLDNPMQQAGNMLALQGGIQKNALAAMQMGELQRKIADTQKLRGIVASSSEEDLPSALRKGGFLNEALETEGKRAAVRANLSKAQLQEAQLADQYFGVIGQAFAPLSQNPNTTGDDVVNTLAGLVKVGALPEKYAMNIAEAANKNTLSIPDFVKNLVVGSSKGRDALKMYLPDTVDAGGSLVDKNPMSPTFKQPVVTKTVTPDAKLRDETTKSEGELGRATTIRGQNLVDSRMRQQLDPTIQETVAEAKERGKSRGESQVKAEISLPSIESAASSALENIDTMIGKRDKNGGLMKGSKPHPGFESVVGATYMPGARFVPGTNAADFQARLDQLKGGAFLQAFESLKGGGQITEVEGKKATDAITRMSTAQSEKEFVTAAREFKAVIENGLQKARSQAGERRATPRDSTKRIVVDF